MNDNPADMPSILIVDDTPENLDILKGVLKTDYTVRVATNGALALRIACSELAPDLILLDILMPDMDGYEVIRQLKANPLTESIPVIFVTTLSDMFDEMNGFSLGAADYVTKPFNVALVLARVRTHLALAAARKEIARRNRMLLAERDVIEEVILQMRDNRAFDKRGLRYKMSSLDKTNGDVLLSAFTPGASQWVLTGDIAGHGPSAAIGIPLVAQIFYRNVKAGNDPLAALTELNQAMYEKLPATIYMPYVLAVVSADRTRCHIWNGGLPGCYLDQPGCAPTHFPTSTFAMGMCEDYKFDEPESYEIELPPDGRLWVFTDGLSEVLLANRQRLGVDRMVALLSNISPLDGLDVLWEELETHHGITRFSDDTTLVEIRPCLVANQPQ
jgi:CheY-like chemotaxis protein